MSEEKMIAEIKKNKATHQDLAFSKGANVSLEDYNWLDPKRWTAFLKAMLAARGE